jgi:hypothetical protein
MTLGDHGNFYQLMFNIETMSYFVYTIELDGKVIYVGQTKDIFGRLRQYKCVFINRKCHNPKLQGLFDAGDLQRATFDIVAMSATRREILKIENDFIEEHRDTCFNKYDTFSESTRKKISVAARKMWMNPKTRKNIVTGISKKHTLTSPAGIVREFLNSYETKTFLEKIGCHLHKNDRKRIGYQMLESCGENKGWKMVIEGKRPPSKWSRGTLTTPTGEEISINGKWELVNLNREKKLRMNVNRLIKSGHSRGFTFVSDANKNKA